jgi:telomerase reverse transcriptase
LFQKKKDGLLKKCHLIIKKIRDENSEVFGSSVFDYNSIHQNLSNFISSVRSQLKEQNKIYIVVADVSKAFDCISHDMVLKVMDNVLKCDDYVMRRCTKVVCNRSKNAIYRFDSNFCISNGDNMGDFSIQFSSGGGILVDQVLYVYIVIHFISSAGISFEIHVAMVKHIPRCHLKLVSHSIFFAMSYSCNDD